MFHERIWGLCSTHNLAWVNKENGPDNENPVRKLKIVMPDVLPSLHFLGDMDNVVDFSQEKRYITMTNSSTVSNLDYINDNPYTIVKVMSEPRPKMVAVDTVVRGGAFAVSSIAAMSLLATWLSGAIIIQPIFAMLLVLLSIGFYAMTLVKV
jgi:hypothetical protein